MKKHVFIFMAFFVMCSTLMMVSCSDDDKGENDKKSFLIGKWVLVYSYYEDEHGSIFEDEYLVSEEEDVIVFKEDGVCRNYLKNNDTVYERDDYGEWKLVDDSYLKLLFDGEGQQIVTISELTQTSLTFEYNDGIDEYIGIKYKMIMRYQKVD